ncbi:MAG: hypothetical protein R3Y53_04985 [Bacillota bacterium]
MYQTPKLPDHLQKKQAQQQVKSVKPELQKITDTEEKPKENHISSREGGQKSQSYSLLPLALAFLLLKE